MTTRARGQAHKATASAKHKRPAAAERLPLTRGQDEYVGPRQRAAALRERMARFRKVYNAAWFVRNASASFNPQYRQDKATLFWNAVLHELKDCDDQEALVYAVADAITAFPRGMPWEG
jgi:hypothetical protein